jgi:excisionase family DNA binding protein
MTLIEELGKRDSYLTTTEVMKLLKMRRNTLCEWIRAGRISAIRTGSGYRFDPYTLAVWLAERTTSKGSHRGAA